MKDAIALDANEIKKIIAEKFGVPVENVVKAQYSYFVIKEDKTCTQTS